MRFVSISFVFLYAATVYAKRSTDDFDEYFEEIDVDYPKPPPPSHHCSNDNPGLPEHCLKLIIKEAKDAREHLSHLNELVNEEIGEL